MTYVVRGNALQIPMAGESVDLIVTSPPYFALRSYRDGDEHYAHQIGSEPTPKEFLEALWSVMAECWRVLKPEGSCWVNLGDKYAGSGGHNNEGISRATRFPTASGSPPTARRTAGEIESRGQSTRRNAPDHYNKASDVRPKSLMGLPWSFANGCIGAFPFEPGLAAPDGQTWILRAEVCWSKPNGLPESVTDRVRRSHEQWFHFTKTQRYFSAVDEIREPVLYPGMTHRTVGKGHAGANGLAPNKGLGGACENSLGRLPGSVWTVPSEPLMIPDWARERWNLPDHFAAFPQEFPRRIILGWSPSGICQECGQGRRPAIERQVSTARGRPGGHAVHGSPVRPSSSTLSEVAGYETTITGYACACSDDSAPTRPAVVLDPFGGTGTVAMVAKALGRTGISLDLSADYCRLADWRINHSNHAKKTEARTWAERQGVLS